MLAYSKLLAAAFAGLIAVLPSAGPASATGAPAHPAVAAALTASTAREGEPVGGPALTGEGVVVRPGTGSPPPEVASGAYVVADAESGAVLAAKAPHQRYRPASTIKTLTALTASDIAPDATYVATEADAAVIGTHAGLIPGSSYTLEDLMYGMFLKSGNDAAVAIANLAGGVPEFVQRMNVEAERLQAYDTHAVTPEGLDEPGQLTSAYDLALLGRAALRDPELSKYASTKVYEFPDKQPEAGQPRKSYEIFSIQRFLLNYDGALGIKNGYTTQARQTLIAASKRGDRTIIVTLLQGGYGSWRDAVALSDWAYANAGKVEPVGELVEPLPRPEPETQIRSARTAIATDTSEGSSPERALLLATLIGISGAILLVAVIRPRQLVLTLESIGKRGRR